jgi:hypothetical protein
MMIEEREEKWIISLQLQLVDARTSKREKVNHILMIKYVIVANYYMDGSIVSSSLYYSPYL